MGTGGSPSNWGKMNLDFDKYVTSEPSSFEKHHQANKKKTCPKIQQQNGQTSRTRDKSTSFDRVPPKKATPMHRVHGRDP